MEAHFDGFEVMMMEYAVPIGDIFITATGDTNVIDHRHFELLKEGSILCNAGHFDVEVCMKELNEVTKTKREVRKNIDEHTLSSGKTIYVLGKGRLVNLACADGHPAEIMDLSFSLQALSLLYGYHNAFKLKRAVIQVPIEVDERVAQLKLASIGITIDKLTKEQQLYLESWQ